MGLATMRIDFCGMMITVVPAQLSACAASWNVMWIQTAQMLRVKLVSRLIPVRNVSVTYHQYHMMATFVDLVMAFTAI